MQLTDKKNMGLRTTYYWAKMFVEQLKLGGKYQDLQKTITINILNYNIFPKIERFHTTFHIREDELSFVLTDRLEIHFIELGKFRRLRSEKNITDPLHQWLMFLDEKDEDILEVLKMTNPAIDRAEKILEWLSADEDTLVTYRLREKSLHERASMIADAKEEGREEGMKEGMKEGEMKKAKETAKAALIEGSNIEFVAKITGLPIEIIQQLKNELN